MILDIKGLTKVYSGGLKALDNVDLAVRRGEIFALLGPNGAGKTTLIGAVCGMVRPTSGTIHAFGQEIARDWRKARARIGLVPQELGFDIFETVQRSVAFSRGLFGCPPDPARLEEILRSLALWDKRDSQIRHLSGGMKRRVLIAKALAHDPELLFLDEPTAGVDVELRRDMWRLIEGLRDAGTTIILTTHYIDEAEEMADRVGVIQAGRLLLVEDKHALMARMGRVEALFRLGRPLAAIPPALAAYPLSLDESGTSLCYRGSGREADGEVAALVQAMVVAGVAFTSLDIHESSLEDVFVDLMEGAR
jgi:ABC-2 type transport system ATP-binding protein